VFCIRDRPLRNQAADVHGVVPEGPVVAHAHPVDAVKMKRVSLRSPFHPRAQSRWPIRTIALTAAKKLLSRARRRKESCRGMLRYSTHYSGEDRLS
jgi:hypothetical protein